MVDSKFLIAVGLVMSGHAWAVQVPGMLEVSGDSSQANVGAAVLPDGHTRSGEAWSLEQVADIVIGSRTTSVAVGHISGNARPDIVVATSYYFDPDNDHHLFLLRPEGLHGFLPPLKFPYGMALTNYPGLAVVDLDGNNGMDVVVGGSIGITRFLATPQGGLVASPPETTLPLTAMATLALTGSGWKDVLTVGSSLGSTIYRNVGNGALGPMSWEISLPGPHELAVGDIDGDGLDDAAVANGGWSQAAVELFHNTGEGELKSLGQLQGACPGTGGGIAEGVGIGDFNSDGHADVVVSSGTNSPTSCIMLHHGDGKGGFNPPIYMESLDMPATIRIADIDGDRRADVIVAHDAWNHIGVYLQRGDGSLADERLFPVPSITSGPHVFEIADLDTDGCLDITVVTFSSVMVLKGRNCGIIFTSGFES